MPTKVFAPLRTQDPYTEERRVVVDAVARAVRDRCLAQYCAPYATVCLRRMAGAFAMPLDALEASVADLVARGAIAAECCSADGQCDRRWPSTSNDDCLSGLSTDAKLTRSLSGGDVPAAASPSSWYWYSSP